MSQLVLFLGVGKMGLPMARHLHTAGHSVQVHDLDADRLNMAQQAGLPLAGDVQAKVQQADVIISSLPHDAALLGVAEWLSQVGRAGQVWVDTSTVSLSASALSAQRVTDRGMEHLRVTVSGNNQDRKSTRLNSSHSQQSRMPSSA